MNHSKFVQSLVFIFFIFALSSSCNKNTEATEKAFLSDAISKIKINNNTNWLVILPGLGCDGCIQEGEVFMKEHIANKKILFVLTNLSSLKILEQKTGIKLKEHPNILIDRENKFNVPTDNGIYPCIIRINDNKIVEHEFQCPKNSMAFRKLKNQISL